MKQAVGFPVGRYEELFESPYAQISASLIVSQYRWR